MLIIKAPIRVIIADDHILFRDGLKQLLEKAQDIRVVGEASNGRKLVELAAEMQPDIVMTDLRMPVMEGIEAVRRIIAFNKSIKCIVFSTFDDNLLILDALDTGASGYIIKTADREDMLHAVYTVWEGKPYYCKTTSFKLARQLGKSKFNPYNNLKKVFFTEKELQVVNLICQDKKSEEIGNILFMSKRTVEGYRSRLLEKMNVQTTSGIVVYALKNKLVDLEQDKFN